MIAINNRITGALVGLAIGDALGAPFENLDSQEIASMIQDGSLDYVGGGSLNYRPGQGTDDTELALLVSTSLIEQQKLDMADISRKLVIWGKTQSFLGPSTGTGLRALESGVHFRKAGNTSSASSGCLPRCVPIGLVFPLENLVYHTIECCLPTHRHPLAIGACVAQNLILQSLIQGFDWCIAQETLNEQELWEGYVDLVPIQKAVKGEFREPGAVDVLSEAILCVSQADCPEQAISMAVRMGGDTDTRAAVAGTLAGARWGGAFPQKWLEGCEGYPETLKWGLELIGLRETLNMKTNK